MPPPSPQRLYFEVKQVSSHVTPLQEKEPFLPAWLAIFLAIVIFSIGVRIVRLFGRRNPHRSNRSVTIG